jgi:hypothetical protein
MVTCVARAAGRVPASQSVCGICISGTRAANGIGRMNEARVGWKEIGGC